MTTRIIQNGDSQALIIPEELRMERTEYCIEKKGKCLSRSRQRIGGRQRAR